MKILSFLVLLLSGCYLHENHAEAVIHSTADNSAIGKVVFKDTGHGMSVKVNLDKLPAGQHGFHIHENPDCSAGKDTQGNQVAAQAAGGHYDPLHTAKHLGPNNQGHKGDLPALEVNKDGKVNVEFYLSNLTVKEVKNRSLVIHAGGDNYQDEPLPLGGGGARIACGIIK